MINKEKLIDYSIIALIAFIYFYSSILAIYIYFWISEHTTTAVSLGVIEYIFIYLTVLYITNKLIDLILKLFLRIKHKIQNTVDDIVNED